MLFLTETSSQSSEVSSGLPLTLPLLIIVVDSDERDLLVLDRVLIGDLGVVASSDSEFVEADSDAVVIGSDAVVPDSDVDVPGSVSKRAVERSSSSSIGCSPSTSSQPNTDL